jgi:peptide/nickel transport system permease protein
MGMQVDPAGRHQQPARIDHFTSNALFDQIGPDRRNAGSADPNVRDSVEILAWIDDPAATHNHVEHPCFLRSLVYDERRDMIGYILRRLVALVPVLFAISIITFTVNLLLPGDPALAYIGEANINDKVMYQAVRQELGLDEPIPVQYVKWLGHALHGDLGHSIRTREPAVEGLLARLPVTLELSLIAMAISLGIAVPIGILSAVRPNSKLDLAGTLVAMAGIAVPDFWLAILLIYVVSVWWRVLPSSGFVPLEQGLWANLQSMVLPSVALGMGLAGVVMRQLRSALIEVMQQEYVLVARAKGLRESSVLSRHALKNALIPVITILGLQTGRLFGGAVLIETIFSLPGLGRLATDSILFRDYPMLEGVVFILALAVALASLVTDVTYAVLDPRIRYVS